MQCTRITKCQSKPGASCAKQAGHHELLYPPCRGNRLTAGSPVPHLKAVALRAGSRERERESESEREREREMDSGAAIEMEEERTRAMEREREREMETTSENERRASDDTHDSHHAHVSRCLGDYRPGDGKATSGRLRWR